MIPSSIIHSLIHKLYNSNEEDYSFSFHFGGYNSLGVGEKL